MNARVATLVLVVASTTTMAQPAFGKQADAEHEGAPSVFMAAPDGEEGNARFAALAASSAIFEFQRFLRDPTEQPGVIFTQMEVGTDNRPTAYFRDTHFAGQTQMAEPSDGDAWLAKAFAPGGAGVITWSPIRYFDSYEGQSQCWVNEAAPNDPVCGSRSLNVIWFAGARCVPHGLWHMQWSYSSPQNGIADEVVGSEFFTMMRRIPPTLPNGTRTVTSFNQAGPWGQDHYDDSCWSTNSATESFSCQLNVTPKQTHTIQRKGCFMVALANVLRYHSVLSGGGDESVGENPGDLNAALKQRQPEPDGPQRGYTAVGRVEPFGVSQFAASRGRLFWPAGWDSPSGPSLDFNICNFGPQVMKMSDHHFVTVLGREGSDFVVNDPNGGHDDQLFPPAQGMRYYAGSGSSPSNQTGVILQIASPAQLLLTDPQGRRTGIDPSAGQVFNEIPRGNYDPDDGLRDNETGDPGPSFKTLIVRAPVAGNYQIRVTGIAETRTSPEALLGTYNLEVRTYGPQATRTGYFTQSQVPIAVGEVHRYEFSYTGTTEPGEIRRVTDVPFASFTVLRDRLAQRETLNTFAFVASYALGANSDGIKPANEAVTVSLIDAAGETYSEVLPAGSFAPLKNGSGFKYRGSAGHIVSMSIANDGQIMLTARGVGARPVDESTLRLRIKIGDDVGEAPVPFP